VAIVILNSDYAEVWIDAAVQLLSNRVNKMTRFRIAAIVIVCASALSLPHTVDACTCSAIPTFEQEARGRPFVLAARIGALVSLRSVSHGPVLTGGPYVAAIDVDVIAVIRGHEARQRLRIWDQFVGGSCSLGLQELKEETLLVLAINPAEERLHEVWEILGFHPGEKDYVWGTCPSTVASV
jgi:hypothetical protein